MTGDIGILNARIAGVALPERMRGLPVSPTGFPIPWFVWIKEDGTPDFRVVGSGKVEKAHRMRLCWLCGQPRGRHWAFVTGPMCTVNRTTSEPPSHRDCAVYAAKACPFLTQPRMRRNAKDLPEERTGRGIGIDRNPGVTAVYLSQSYKPFNAEGGAGGVLFTMGEPDEVLWFAEGRTATRAEVMASVDSGMPILRDAARLDGREGEAALERCYQRFLKLLPAQGEPGQPGSGI